MKNYVVFILVASFSWSRSAPTPTTPHDDHDCDHEGRPDHTPPCVTPGPSRTHHQEEIANSEHRKHGTPGEIAGFKTNSKDTNHHDLHDSTSRFPPTSHQAAHFAPGAGYNVHHASPHPGPSYGTGPEQLGEKLGGHAAPSQYHGSALSTMQEFSIGFEHALFHGGIHHNLPRERKHVNLPIRPEGSAHGSDPGSMQASAHGSDPGSMQASAHGSDPGSMQASAHSSGHGSTHANGQGVPHVQDTGGGTLPAGMTPAVLRDTNLTALTAVTTAMLTTACTALLVALAAAA